MTDRGILERVLARVIYVLASIGLSFWALLTSVGWCYHGTGITKSDGRYLLRKGYVVIDPGQAIGFVLYTMSWTMIVTVVTAFMLSLVLLNQAGHIEEFKNAFKGADLEPYKRLFQVAAFTIVIPFIVQLLAWALR